MTELDLKAIEARVQASTPDQWRITGFSPTDDDGLVTLYIKAGNDEVGSIKLYRPADRKLVIHAKGDIEALLAEVRRLRADRDFAQRASCEWVEDNDGVWETSCGSVWYFDSGGLPSEHHAQFCMFCGRKIDETPAGDADDASTDDH